MSADLDRIARTHGIRMLLQFGSTVTGRVHARSDVDLAVVLKRPSLTLAEHGELVHDLQALFPDREIDLAILNRADPLFLKQDMNTCRLLYGAPVELHRLRLLAFKRHQDHRKYLDRARRFVADAVTAAAGRG